MYTYRVRAANSGHWSRWADWSTTSLNELIIESRKASPRPVRRVETPPPVETKRRTH